MEKPVKTNFTIEHILNCAGGEKKHDGNVPSTSSQTVPFYDPYSWLQCTRYCPPKVPRNYSTGNLKVYIFNRVCFEGVPKNRNCQKRQLGRHPRIPFTPHQLAVLEAKFHQTPYLSSEEVIELAKQLQLADIRVCVLLCVCETV